MEDLWSPVVVKECIGVVWGISLSWGALSTAAERGLCVYYLHKRLTSVVSLLGGDEGWHYSLQQMVSFKYLQPIRMFPPQ